MWLCKSVASRWRKLCPNKHLKKNTSAVCVSSPACCHATQVGADGKTLVSEKGDVIPEVDVIVFATGFNLTATISQFDIQARGCDLNETVNARPEAYYGLAVAGFPNIFTLLGLNTGG